MWKVCWVDIIILENKLIIGFCKVKLIVKFVIFVLVSSDCKVIFSCKMFSIMNSIKSIKIVVIMFDSKWLIVWWLEKWWMSLFMYLFM